MAGGKMHKGGVYSSKGNSWIGTGTTKRKVMSKKYWYALELPDGTYKVQPLTSNMVPAGTPRTVSVPDFRRNYEFEPDFYVDPQRFTDFMPELQAVATEPVLEEVSEEKLERKPPRQAIRQQSKEEIDRLEIEARTDFGMGLTFFRTGNTRKALEIFNAIPDMNVDWQPEHKHMFSEFGAGLRKTRLLDVALKHYFKALELAPQDENLHHNIARVFYEQSKYDTCKEWLEKSLKINPSLVPSKQFLTFLHKSGKLPSYRI